jgi:hypothetical protein
MTTVERSLHSDRVEDAHRRHRLKWLVPVLAAGTAAVAVSVAPTAGADSEFCTNLSTSATKCEKPGNVEVNDSFARSNTLPQWASQGQQSGGPYGGTLGGGSR